MEDSLARMGIVGNLYKVYLAAIELGDVPVSTVIERTGLPKATVYDAVAKLQQEGLVAAWKGSGIKRVVAHDPSVLLEMVEARKQMMTEMLPQLRALYHRSKGKPNIRFYEGPAGVETALWDSLTDNSPVVHAVFAMAELMDMPGLDVIGTYQKERIDKRKHMYVMRSKERDRAEIWGSSREELRELRFLPPETVISMTFIIYGGRVAFMSSKKECYGLIIESEEYADLMRAMYQGLWGQSDSSPYLD